MVEDAMIAELRARFDGNDNNNNNGNGNAKANAIVAAAPPVLPLNIPSEDGRTLSHLHMSFRIGARVFVNIKGRDYNGKVKVKGKEENSGRYSVDFAENIPSRLQY